MNIYFLGGGNMATAIAGGLVKQDGYRVHIVERGAERRAQLVQELGVATSENLPELSADGCPHSRRQTARHAGSLSKHPFKWRAGVVRSGWFVHRYPQPLSGRQTPYRSHHAQHASQNRFGRIRYVCRCRRFRSRPHSRRRHHALCRHNRLAERRRAAPQYYRHQRQRPRLCFLSVGRAPKRGFGTRFQRTRRTRTEPRHI